MSERRRGGTGPLTAAGLVRFYEEADVGIKLSPYLVIAFSLGITIAVIIAHVLAPP